MIMYYQKRCLRSEYGNWSESKLHRGVANVGVKPTFHDPTRAELVIEVNIFDFNENIYGERVTVYWHHF